MKKEKKKNRKRLMIATGLIFLLLAGTGFAGFLGNLTFQGQVTTATITFEIEEYSGTWVYKDMETGEIVISYDGPLTDPDYVLVADCYAMPGTQGKDFDMIFNNLFPCVYFKCNAIIHYTGSLPVHLKNISFTADEWLEPYIFYRAYSCTKEGDEFIKGKPVPIGYQLHNCMYLYIDIIIKLPQLNSLQNKVGSFSGELEFLQWSDDCEKYINLPGTPVTMVAEGSGAESFFDITLSNVPDGYTVVDGVYLGWCIDEETTMLQDTELPVYLISSYDPVINSFYPDDDWDLVNYLINHKNDSASVQDIQDAIWYFINGGIYPTDPHAISMVEDAIANGEGFIPTTGQWIAVYVLNEYQQIFIEVDP